MKNLYNIHPKASWFLGMLLMLVAILGSSCERDIYDEFDLGVNAPLKLTTSKEALVLQEAQAGSEAIAFNWTTGSNYGTSSAIAYKLYLDKQGNDFKNAVVVDMGKTTYQKKYTVQEFNNLLLSGLKLTPGTEASVEAKIVTKVLGTNHSDSTTSVVKVTSYRPVTTTLYLIGDATPNGWSAENATPLTLNPTSPGQFTWQGRLKPGEFKLITTKGAFLPSYNKGAGNNKLILRTVDSQPDDKFVITKNAPYAISVNLLDLTITIEEGSAPPYSQLWIVGDATPNGWNIDNPNQMRVDRSNPFVFTYNEVLKAGEFKIPTAAGNWGGDFYMPLVNQQPLSATGVQLVRGGNPDNKWRVTTPGAYKIKLDLETMKIDIKPFTPYNQLWMVGDATPAGWNIDNPTPLTKDANNPYIFTYTGALKVGEMKIPVATGNWGGDFFMPVTPNEGTNSTEMKFVPGGNPDNKWKITEAGNYRITIDQLRETIKFEKQ